MKLCMLNEGMVAPTLIEGYGRVLDIDYDNFKVDPKPKVLRLGDWRHPNTKNHLVAGINLNYLRGRDLDRLRYYLPEILKDKHLYVRYHTGKKLLPDLFKNYYRTYRADRINVIDQETLKHMSPKELEQQGDKERAGRLAKRRDELRAARSKKRPRIRAARRPEIEPTLPPEIEPLPPEVSPDMGVPEEPDVDSTKEKARAAVDATRANKMAARIDARASEPIEPDEPEGEAPEEELPPEEEVPPEEEE